MGYLCCDDLDPGALESIARHCGGLQVPIFIHDDSESESCRAAVDALAARLATRFGRRVQVLRRTAREGGKALAVNNLVDYLPEGIEYLLLCDSDSHFYRGDVLERGIAHFHGDDVAVVQFRTIGHPGPGDGPLLRTLSESISFYDAFVHCLERFGWTPFLGHNALLRTSVFRRVGGLTGGELADDIEYSVRLRLLGYRIRYARDVVGGERHPQSYRALRRRTQKWTYGCTQVLGRFGWSVLAASPGRIGTAEKLTFFLTVSYYHFQVLLLVYLTLFYLLLPFSPEGPGSGGSLLLSAGMILFLTFVPSLSYFAHAGRGREWPRVAVWWSLTYGSQDFVMVSAVARRLLGRTLRWVPTNAASGDRNRARYGMEVTFGATILLVAAARAPVLLFLPTTLLFAGKFLAAPLLARGRWDSPGAASSSRPGGGFLVPQGAGALRAHPDGGTP